MPHCAEFEVGPWSVAPRWPRLQVSELLVRRGRRVDERSAVRMHRWRPVMVPEWVAAHAVIGIWQRRISPVKVPREALSTMKVQLVLHETS